MDEALATKSELVIQRCKIVVRWPRYDHQNGHEKNTKRTPRDRGDGQLNAEPRPSKSVKSGSGDSFP